MWRQPLAPLDWLALTRVSPPLPRGDVIARPRLAATLRAAMRDHALTLLSAPAGSGKTTLLTAWLAELAAEPGAPAVAWLSLDEDDNDPARFFAGLVAAVQRAAPALEPELAAQAAAAPQLAADPRRLAAGLINALGAAGPLILALDDLHHITAPALFAALDALLERPPAQLRLLVATRADPPLSLARLRARRQVFELRLDDLRFTEGETAELLRTLCRLALPAEQLDRLYRRTEGWAAGLSMLASSLDRIAASADRELFLAHLQRTDRYIFEFLAEEVLSRQDPAVRAFLLESAVLPELTPELCRAVTGRPDAPAMLDELYQRNLFLVALGAGPAGEGAPAYRYHDLFRAFLLARLEREAPEWLAALRRRAARADPSPARRVQHLLEARLWPEAAEAIAAAGPALLRDGAYTLLEGWVAALPAGLVAGDPRLLYLRGCCAWERYELERGLGLLRQAHGRLGATGDADTWAAVGLRLAMMELATGSWGRARALVDEALAGAPPPHAYAQAMAMRANLRLADGDPGGERALADLDAALAAAEASDDPRAALAVLEHGPSGPVAALPGALARLARTDRLLERFREGRADAVRLGRLELRAYTQLWRGAWPEAMATCDEMYLIAERLGAPQLQYVYVGAIRPVCLAIAGRHAEADAAFEALFKVLEGVPPASAPLLEVPFRFWLGKARWLQGRPAELRAAYERVAAIERAHGAHFLCAAVGPLLRALLALAEGRLPAALEELGEAAAIQARQPFAVIFGDARLLAGHVLLRQGREAEALAAAGPAVAEWAAEDAPGHLMWEGQPLAPLLRLAAGGPGGAVARRALGLLEALGPGAPPAGPAPGALPSGEALSARELEVLRLVAAGASNGAIAERLVISLHTVKNHLKSILDKLDARSRTEAAARARELGLLE